MYVDADFAGNYNKEDSATESYTARSRHGYIIMYAGCPIIWKSKMQTVVALSSTEAEFIGLSEALRAAIPMMELLKELMQYGFDVGTFKPNVHCRVFEDNSGAIEIAKVPKTRACTKMLNIRYHHFCDYVDRGEIEILPIKSGDQPADMLTKALNFVTLPLHRKTIMGWEGQEARGSVRNPASLHD